MSVAGGPDLVVNNLSLCLDAANVKSHSGTGTSWVNLTRSGYNATLTNGATFNSANGGVIVFDGTNDYSSSGAIAGSFASFTVIAWFYPTSLKNYANVLDCNYSYNGTTGNIGPRLELNASGNLGWTYSNITNNNGSYYGHSVLTSGLQANKWHYAAITYSSNSSTTYYNGKPTGLSRTTVGSPTGFIGTVNNLNIGRGYSLITTSERYFAGRVSSVQVYNRLLSASEILQNYKGTKGRFRL